MSSRDGDSPRWPSANRTTLSNSAPGLAITARMTLACRPRSYVAVERDRDAAATVEGYLIEPSQRCIVASAEETGLPSASASIVYGEAMLSMQPATTKGRIVAEAARLLKPGGYYGIHELCLIPDDVDQATRDAIQRDLSSEIHVGVRPLTASEWREVLETAGLETFAEHKAPMRLLNVGGRCAMKDSLASCFLPGTLPGTPLRVAAYGPCEECFTDTDTTWRPSRSWPGNRSLEPSQHGPPIFIQSDPAGHDGAASRRRLSSIGEVFLHYGEPVSQS